MAFNSGAVELFRFQKFNFPLKMPPGYGYLFSYVMEM